jgi:hypothetical protein
MTNNAERSGSWPCSSSTTCRASALRSTGSDAIGSEDTWASFSSASIMRFMRAGRRCDPVHVIMRDPIERVAEVFLQQPGEAVDDAQGCAQVVRYGCTEGFQLSCRELQVADTRLLRIEQPIDAGAFGTQVRRLGGQTVERQRGQQRHAVERRNRIEAQGDLVRDGIAVEDARPAAHSWPIRRAAPTRSATSASAGANSSIGSRVSSSRFGSPEQRTGGRIDPQDAPAGVLADGLDQKRRLGGNTHRPREIQGMAPGCERFGGIAQHGTPAGERAVGIEARLRHFVQPRLPPRWSGVGTRPVRPVRCAIRARRVPRASRPRRGYPMPPRRVFARATCPPPSQRVRPSSTASRVSLLPSGDSMRVNRPAVSSSQ